MPPKKTKFVSLQTAATSESPVFPGRLRCECQTIKHPLVNNCLSCGRVVCLQEGPGPCTFCGKLVLTKSQRAKVAAGNTKEEQRLIAKYNKMQQPLNGKDGEKDYMQVEAQATKERLLEYDRTTATRTKVIDDQSDYFASENPWLSEEEKCIMKKKQEAYMNMKNRLKKKTRVTIDFAGRRIIEEAPEMPDFNSPAFQITPKTKESDRMIYTNDESHPAIDKPKFVGDLQKINGDARGAPGFWSSRIQDSELQEITDAGNCLSVLQPYASLIIEGIKLFEGRSWYTSVRGRLWICSGNRQPTQELINQVQASYRIIAGENVEFPTNYNCGCLLGCVELIDCIPHEEYLELYPYGEVNDPYVFVMANPKILSVKLPIQPKNNIFKLDRTILQTVKNALK